jgi:two-component system LytT family response regulator
VSIRVLVTDDEPLAQRRLVSLLRKEDDVEIVGVASNGREALEAVEKHAPDLLFLDVQMPEMDGFEVVRTLGPERVPVVVFVTAYDRYALQAFEVHALDYLLKPYSPQRLQEALGRARRLLEGRRPDTGAQTLAAVERAQADRTEESPPDEVDAAPEPRILTRILVKENGKLFFVKTVDVDWFESESNYVRLHSAKKSYLVRGRMNTLEERLPREQFMRIHRSTIVNLDRIKEVYPWFGGDYIVTLLDGTQLKLSRSYRANLSQKIG